MRARNQRVGGQVVVGTEFDALGSARNRTEVARHDRDIGFGLVREDPQLRVAVRVERSVAVEVVGLEVEQHRDAWAEAVNVLELKARQLADDPVVVSDRAVEAGERTADVAGDGGRSSGGTEDRA